MEVIFKRLLTFPTCMLFVAKVNDILNSLVATQSSFISNICSVKNSCMLINSALCVPNELNFFTFPWIVGIFGCFFLSFDNNPHHICPPRHHNGSKKAEKYRHIIYLVVFYIREVQQYRSVVALHWYLVLCFLHNYTTHPISAISQACLELSCSRHS